jgi:hypothetical protein
MSTSMHQAFPFSRPFAFHARMHVATCRYPRVWTVYPASVIVGGGSALLWVAEGQFITAAAAAATAASDGSDASHSTGAAVVSSEDSINRSDGGVSSINGRPAVAVDVGASTTSSAEPKSAATSVLGLFSGIFMMAFALTQVTNWPCLLHVKVPHSRTHARTHTHTHTHTHTYTRARTRTHTLLLLLSLMRAHHASTRACMSVVCTPHARLIDLSSTTLAMFLTRFAGCGQCTVLGSAARMRTRRVSCAC